MPMYCIGDIQGCNAELGALLHAIDFSPSRDTLYVLGDLVNRGPDSAGVVRRLRALEGAAHCLLGNHDIHLLAVSQGIRPPHPSDTLSTLLQASDAQALLDWLRQLPLALHANDCLMVHAGVQPDWDLAQTLACANEVSQWLRARDWPESLARLFGNQPARWSPHLTGMDRCRCSLNTLTRIRFLDAHGSMDFVQKRGIQEAPPGLIPWFDFPARKTASTLLAFGHWSALGLVQRPHLLALDTGCVWGGQLSAAEIRPAGQIRRIAQVPCQRGAVGTD